MSAAVSLSPAFTTRHGDRKFRIRAAGDWRHWRTPLPSVAEARAFATWVRRQFRETGSVWLPCSGEDTARLIELCEAISPSRGPRAAITARPSGKRPVNTHWIVQMCALQRYAEGRGPYPLPPRSKKYEPVPIVWGELPPDLRRGFELVAESLTWRRRTGEEGETRLVALNKHYKRWTRGRSSTAQLVAEAEAFVAFVEAAPGPDIFEPATAATAAPPEKIDAETIMAAVRRLVARAPAHVRTRLEEDAITEALLGVFEPTDSTETRAKRAIWRVEARVRRDIRRTAEKSQRRNGRLDSEPF